MQKLILLFFKLFLFSEMSSYLNGFFCPIIPVYWNIKFVTLATKKNYSNIYNYLFIKTLNSANFW